MLQWKFKRLGGLKLTLHRPRAVPSTIFSSRSWIPRHPSAEASFMQRVYEGEETMNTIGSMVKRISIFVLVDHAEKVAKVMREAKFDTITGKARFVGVKTYGPPAYLSKIVFLSKYEGGKFVTYEAAPRNIP